MTNPTGCFPLEIWLKITDFNRDPASVVRLMSSCKTLYGRIYREFLLVRFEVACRETVIRVLECKECKHKSKQCCCYFKGSSNKIPQYKHNNIVTDKDIINAYVEAVLDPTTPNFYCGGEYRLYITYGMCLQFILDTLSKYMDETKLKLDFVKMTHHFICDDVRCNLYRSAFVIVANNWKQPGIRRSETDTLHYKILVDASKLSLIDVRNGHLDILNWMRRQNLGLHGFENNDNFNSENEDDSIPELVS